MINARTAALSHPPAWNRMPVFLWILYNWAHDGFPILITSFVFSAYFATAVAQNETMGSIQWGAANAVAGILTALLAPFLGARADLTHRRLFPLAGFSLMNIVCVLLLWFTLPNQHWVGWALFFYTIASFSFETTYIYYNAMLKTLVPSRITGRVSGWGWACGYFGGIVCLLIAIFVLVKPEWITHAHSYNVRAVTLLCAGWFLAFGWPLFVFVKEATPVRCCSAQAVVSRALNDLKMIFKLSLEYRLIFRFLIAHLFYIDALNTVFVFAGIYASVVYHLSLADILFLGLSANISAGVGTALLSYVDDGLGPRFVIFWSIMVLLLADAAIFFTHHVSVFWVASLSIAFFSGAMQSASRSYLTHVSPPDRINQMFGLYAMTGRATAFLGPVLAVIFIVWLHNVRFIIPAVFVLGLIGLLFLITLPSTKDFSMDVR